MDLYFHRSLNCFEKVHTPIGKLSKAQNRMVIAIFCLRNIFS